MMPSDGRGDNHVENGVIQSVPITGRGPEVTMYEVTKDDGQNMIASVMVQAHASTNSQDTETDSELGTTKKQAKVFYDRDDLRAQIWNDLKKPEYNVHDYYFDTGMCQLIARSPLFDQITMMMIATNAIWIWIDSDWNDEPVLLDAAVFPFQIVEHMFCFYFWCEWWIRFLSFKVKLKCLGDRWFVFDSLLLLTMVIETWVMTLFVIFSRLNGGAGGSAGGLNNMSIMRMARLLRLTRMARMARLLRHCPELMIIIKGLVAASRSVMFTMALLIVVVYIFAILFKQITVGYDVGRSSFRTVPDGMWTLIVLVVVPDDFNKMTEDLFNQVGTVPAILFIIFMILAAITIMNMLIGVLVDVVSVVAGAEKETLVLNFVKAKMKEIFNDKSGIDHDKDQKISRQEFAEILKNPQATKALRDVDVDPAGLVDMDDFIFEDQEKLTFNEFMEVVLSLRGTENAKVKDIVDLRKYIRKELDKVLHSSDGHHRKNAKKATRQFAFDNSAGASGLSLGTQHTDHTAATGTSGASSNAVSYADHRPPNCFSFQSPRQAEKAANSLILERLTQQQKDLDAVRARQNRVEDLLLTITQKLDCLGAKEAGSPASRNLDSLGTKEAGSPANSNLDSRGAKEAGRLNL
jgi:hypothetical protein